MDECSQNSSELQLFYDKSTEVVVYPELFPDELPSLEAEIKRGYKELKERQQEASKEKRKTKSASRKNDTKVTKILYPAPANFLGCRHNETTIIDRDILNPNEHLRLLATPRVKVSNGYITACTYLQPFQIFDRLFPNHPRSKQPTLHMTPSSVILNNT